MLPDWLPVGGPAVYVQCGLWFDAVVVASYEGVRVVDGLRERSGAAVDDRARARLVWLVEPGSTATWATMAGVTVQRTGALLVPPAHTPVGAPLRWWVPPAGDCLTHPDLLHETLALVITGGPPTYRYLSPDCHLGECWACRHGDPPPPPHRDSSVRAEACAHACHATEGAVR
ncbi:hypothetical protein [Streptomyces sp. NBC_01803]|uniref:hypothetical protein n=1 Tax=Streptomyces sp. NBC_01803 TaxID=2975946 RepID=UPI002DDB1BF6|nr:hypothetical protein [Streptomyces sp. NBC_01803]WSA44532.1 hypothetical protein OIE51_10135 [Streptomyces sp. NBC_01803]